MSKKEKLGLSIRAYAKLLGVSDTAVHKAFESGKIKEGIVYPEDGGRPYVIKEIADREWGDSVNSARGNNSHLVDKLDTEDKTYKSQKSTTPSIDSPLTPEEINSNPEIKDTDSFKEALRKERIYKAKILKLSLLEKQDELVNKADVNKQLFEMGKQIRVVFEALPNSIVDNIMSANDRNEALLLLKKSINDSLTKLVTELR